MKQWLWGAALVGVGAAVVLLARHRHQPKVVGKHGEAPPSFERMADPPKFLFGSTNILNLSEAPPGGLTAMKRDFRSAARGIKYTWNYPMGSSPSPVRSTVLLSSYRNWAARPVYVASNLKYFTVSGFTLSAYTPQGLIQDFEVMMKTNQIAFVRDRTNAIWVMYATNELAFRRQFHLAKQWN